VRDHLKSKTIIVSAALINRQGAQQATEIYPHSALIYISKSPKPKAFDIWLALPGNHAKEHTTDTPPASDILRSMSTTNSLLDHELDGGGISQYISVPFIVTTTDGRQFHGPLIGTDRVSSH
jgi:hypothetical protein